MSGKLWLTTTRQNVTIFATYAHYVCRGNSTILALQCGLYTALFLMWDSNSEKENWSTLYKWTVLTVWQVSTRDKYLLNSLRCLKTGIRSEKCIVRRFRRCENVYLHKNWNLALTFHLSSIRFQKKEGFIHIEDLLWQVIFFRNQLIYSSQNSYHHRIWGPSLTETSIYCAWLHRSPEPGLTNFESNVS